MVIARVRTIITGPGAVGGGIAEHYFLGETGDAEDQAGAIRAWWASVATYSRTDMRWQVEGAVTRLDEATGDVLSVEPIPTPAVVAGLESGEMLPPSNQVLIRWLTSGIVNNRLVRGRTNLPGVTETHAVAGQPSASMRTGIATACASLLSNPTAELMVWSRPSSARPGSAHVVTSSNVWDQFSVLRSRRD